MRILPFHMVALAMTSASPAKAIDFFVTNLATFNAAVPLVRPGDTITLANATWTNADLKFTGNGTAENPITLRAETGGQVFLTGQSRLQLAGSHLIAQGLIFTNGFPRSLEVIAFQTTSFRLATNCRVTECAIIDFNNPTNASADAKWVSLYGFSNRVDHCYFTGKRSKGTLLAVWLPPATNADANLPNYHRIDHNHFGPRPSNGGNGGEIIRVGDSDTSLNCSRTTVEHNYFEECDGEIEVISNKSCENVYRYNTLDGCAGALTLRHGNRCRVEGNYFFGCNKPSTGGVRLYGEDHTIINNYFQELAGSAGTSALTMMQGLQDSPLNGLFQVKNAVVAFNTFVNCSHSLIVGLEATYSQQGTNLPTTLPPVDCTIANNIVLARTHELVDQRITPVNLVWQGNIMFGTKLGIDPTPGILLTDPRLRQGADGLWRPAANSPAPGAAQGNYAFVTDDIRGCLRPSLAKDVGCDQAGSALPLRGPLTPADVGPGWLNYIRARLSFVKLSAVLLQWASVSGAVYQVQTSSNLLTWTDEGAPVTTESATQTWEELHTPVPMSPAPGRFYRIKQVGGPPQPPSSVRLGSTNRPCVSLRWNCVPGCAYQVQISTNAGTWQDVGPVITNTITMQIWNELLAPLTGNPWPAKYYRVKQLTGGSQPETPITGGTGNRPMP